jgi:hypothetical protein
VISSDDELYRVVRTRFEPVRMSAGVGEIMAHGRLLQRRRRLAGTAVVGMMATAVAITLFSAGPFLGGPASAPKNIELASSVEIEDDGDVVLTIRQLVDPHELRTELSKAGVPAMVEFKELSPGAARRCEDVGQPSIPQLSEVISAGSPEPGSDSWVFIIRPALMPDDTTLHLVVFAQPDSNARQTQAKLVKGEPIPCS